MSEYYKPLNRLARYFNIFSCGILTSMNEIAEQMKIPIRVVRNDFYLLFSKGAMFAFEESYDNLYDLLEYNSDKFLKHLNAGAYDDVPICLDLPQLNDEQIYIEATVDEILTLNKILNKSISNKSIITIKEDYNDSHKYKDLPNMLSTVNNAIINKKVIKILYKVNDGSLVQFNLFPLKILHDKSTNLFAILSKDEHQSIIVSRFDKIISVEILSKQFTPDSVDILNILPNVWNNDFTATPYKVKVRFENEVNVFAKVRRDLACRTNGSLYEEDGCLIYEDIVYGINAFKNYIFGYGSSVTVIEPKLLRDMIVDSLKERKQNKESI